MFKSFRWPVHRNVATRNQSRRTKQVSTEKKCLWDVAKLKLLQLTDGHFSFISYNRLQKRSYSYQSYYSQRCYIWAIRILLYFKLYSASLLDKIQNKAKPAQVKGDNSGCNIFIYDRLVGDFISACILCRGFLAGRLGNGNRGWTAWLFDGIGRGTRTCGQQALQFWNESKPERTTTKTKWT